MSFKKISVLDVFLIAFILMYYGRLSVVLFIPQYAIDNGIPSPYYGLHFAMVSIGSAVSNILSIILLRHINTKNLFLGIGVISALYEILLYFYPTPEMLLIAGLLIGLAAGSFWSLTFLVVCEIIDTHKTSTIESFSKYNIVTTVMGAITPLAAGFIVHLYGYGTWLLSALAFLILSTVVIYMLKDPVYYKTYGQYPIKEDLSTVLKDKHTVVTFLLVMLLSTLTVNTWSSISRVFFANVGIRDYWLGIMSVVVSIVTIIIYYLLSKRKVTSRKMLGTLGILIFGAELVLIIFTSDPLIVFILEGVVGTAGIAMVGFATQSIIKNTFRERIYIGRPVFALGMHIANSIWFAGCGYIIAMYGGYESIGSILGIDVDQYGLRVMLVILAGLTFMWALSMWKYEGRMVDG
ncbi:MFS transporter [Methanocella sp. CWC-04]|uniref:MFS transporter n=1 Tax=Methanooceanicella nereidis TaxID=2052831 RepID=A0AAP2W7L3_9EURY|nr:MFS transporter [Methanocella sp. CWC-04]MCD1295181.1 MFS transporter [Methanocella sp. CWC-04]